MAMVPKVALLVVPGVEVFVRSCQGIGRWWCALVALATLAGCQLPLEHAACPCAQGWVCCPTSNVCVAGTSDRCPDQPEPGDAGPDGSPDAGDGVVAIQRLQLEHGWTGDHFGGAVALSGDLAAAGVTGYDGAGSDQGAVVVFERRGGGAGTWVRLAVLVAPDAADGSGFGQTVALPGRDTLLVGAPQAGGSGRVYLFRRVAGAWSWQQTIAPDLSGIPEDEIASMRFGNMIATDANRALIVLRTAAHLYDIAPAGATHVARLDLPGGATGTAVALRGSSAVVVGRAQSSIAYEFEEALGWATPAPITELLNAPTPLAFDGQRLAIWGGTQTVRILERTGSDFGAPIDVAIPIDASSPSSPDLAWRNGELVVTARQATRVLGLLRVRSVGGAWQVDLVHSLDTPLPASSRLAASGDRVMVGLPFASVAGTNPGQAAFFRLDDAGTTSETSIAFDEPALAPRGAIAASAGQVLASATATDRGVWFEREAAQYHRRPSLALDSDLGITSPFVVAGSHALVTVQRANPAGPPNWVQTFELGDRDWIAGPSLTAPESGLAAFASSIAVDGDTAVVTGQRIEISGGGVGVLSNGVAFVYTWSSAGWAHAVTIDSRIVCDPAVAIARARIALSCGTLVRLYERTGQTWYEMPTPVLPQPRGDVWRLVLSGDVVGIASQAPDGTIASDVFRWGAGHWHAELHVRSDEVLAGCRGGCMFGIAAVTTDRLVLYHDATSLAPYRFTGGAWVAQPLLELPSAQRSPDAFVQAVALTGEELIASVASEGDGVNPRAGALYVFPWR